MLVSLRMTSTTCRSRSLTNVERHLQEGERTLDAELLGDGAAHVGEQGIVQSVLFGELRLALHAVHRDADTRGAQGLELRAQVTEVARLLGAARSHRRRIQEEDHGTLAQQGGASA